MQSESPYRSLTSCGIVLMAASASQVALTDVDYELFGEPSNPSTISDAIGGLDSKDFCAISYETGEVVRGAIIPSRTIRSIAGKQALLQLAEIPTLTDLILDARDSVESLSIDWLNWIASLGRITGLTLIGFTDVLQLEQHSSNLQPLARLRIESCEFSGDSLRTLSTIPTMKFLYLGGSVMESEFKPFRADNILGLILDLGGFRLDAGFISVCYPGLRGLIMRTPPANLHLLRSLLPECRFTLEESD